MFLPDLGYGGSLPGSVGKDYLGSVTKIDDPTPNGDGEIIQKSRSVFMGYHREELKTKETFTEDHEWFKTGDIGNLDLSGFLTISGRLKEIIITAGGKNVAPIPIEDSIKAELKDVVSNAVVVGEKKKYLTCLVTLRVTVDPETQQPTQDLDSAVTRWAKRQGFVGIKTIDDFINGTHSERLLARLQAKLDIVNSKADSNVTKVKRLAILPREFSVPGGELTPTLKLKRFVVYEKYADQISGLYEERSSATATKEETSQTTAVPDVEQTRNSNIPAMNIPPLVSA